MAWHLKGELIETCSCNMFCPCWFGVQELMIMDQGWCNATARLFIDGGASEKQRQALEPIVQGQKGGQMEPIAGLISTWLPTKTAPIEVRDDGDTITISVDGPGEVRSDLLRDPEGTPFALRGGGFINGFGLQEAELAPASSRWGDAEMPLESYEAKSGARGAFAWSD
jgi:hypothetical protein